MKITPGVPGVYDDHPRGPWGVGLSHGPRGIVGMNMFVFIGGGPEGGALGREKLKKHVGPPGEP